MPRDSRVDVVFGDLRLRPLAPEDAADLARLRQDPETMRWAHPSGCTVEEAKRAIAEADAAMRAGEAYELAIVPAASDLLLGTIVVRLYGATRASVGYDVAPEARGRGIATRALNAASAWAFETFPKLERLELWIVPGNVASTRVAERTGFQREGVFRSRWALGGELSDVVVFSLLRTDSRV